MSVIDKIIDSLRINRLSGDKVIWTIVFLLSLFSIALVYSSSSSLAYKEHSTNFSFLVKQLYFTVMGLIVLVACYYIPLGWYRALIGPIFWLTVILLAITPVIGMEVNGAKRWISLGIFSFQPTELAKIAIVLYLARVIEVNKFTTFKSFFLKLVVPIGIVCILIMIGSMSAALFVGLICFLILVIADMKWSYIFKAMGIGLAAITLCILLHLAFNIFPRMDTAFSRIEKKIDRKEVTTDLTAEQKQKIADETFQEDMAKVAISSVGILGKGPGKSTQRYFLPHPYSDYIYTIIIEEYGLIFGGCFILMLYLWFLFRCVTLVKRCAKVFTALTVGGLGLLITIQAFLHILVNVGIFPVTGHTLPLVSLGGTSLLIMSCAFGIILSVSRTIDMDSAIVKENTAEKNTAEENTAEESTAKVTQNNEYEILATNGEFK